MNYHIRKGEFYIKKICVNRKGKITIVAFTKEPELALLVAKEELTQQKELLDSFYEDGEYYFEGIKKIS